MRNNLNKPRLQKRTRGSEICRLLEVVGRLVNLTRHLLSHDFIELFHNCKHRIFPIIAPLYSEGHSIRNIAKLTGIPATTINSVLKKNGVQLRTNKSATVKELFQQKFKSSTPPPFGFTYIGGQLEKDTKEFPTLLIIHKQWQLNLTATAITHHLNRLKIKSRMQRRWSRNAIIKIIKRFEDGTITIKKGDSK